MSGNVAHRLGCRDIIAYVYLSYHRNNGRIYPVCFVLSVRPLCTLIHVVTLHSVAELFLPPRVFLFIRDHILDSFSHHSFVQSNWCLFCYSFRIRLK